jgi:hydroxydechloroatrazine ethylaminohydrolase
MPNSHIVWANGEFPGIDEAEKTADADASIATIDF